MKLTDQQIERYHRDGYIHLKNVYNLNEVDKVRAMIENDISTNAWTQAPFFEDGITTDIYERIPGLADIIFKKAYLDSMRSLFQPEPVILAEPAVHKSRYYYWHKDSTFLDEQGFQFHWKSDFQAAMTVFYLQGNHPDYGGGITVVPGSHKSPDFYHRIPKMSLLERAFLKGQKILRRSHFDRMERHPRKKAIPTATGDVLVLDMRLDHKGTPALKPAPITKYGIMNIACSGYHTAERLRGALRDRPSGYYQEYLAKQPQTSPALAEIEQKYEGIKMWL